MFGIERPPCYLRIIIELLARRAVGVLYCLRSWPDAIAWARLSERMGRWPGIALGFRAKGPFVQIAWAIGPGIWPAGSVEGQRPRRSTRNWIKLLARWAVDVRFVFSILARRIRLDQAI